MSAVDGELIAVGRVLRPQGRSGEIRLEPLTDDPARLLRLTECYLVPPGIEARHDVEGVRFQQSVPVMKLRGIDSISDAEALAGRLVAIPRQQVPPLPADRYYAFELAGCAVETTGGQPIGSIVEVLVGSGHDLWVVRDGNREHLIPAVSAIVEAVRLEERRVVVRPPDGLLSLDG